MAAPLINGVNYSWANITFMPFGIPLVGITKLSYKRKQNKENNYGAGPYPVSRGYGNYEYEGSIEVYTDEWKRFIAAAPNRDPMQIAPSDMSVLFVNPRGGLDKDILKMVEFLEDPLDANQGDTKLLVTIPLIIGDIIR